MQPIIISGMTLTEWVIVLGVIFYVLYDVAAKNLWGDRETITYTIQRACEMDYKVAVMSALAFGHIFLSTTRHLHR